MDDEIDGDQRVTRALRSQEGGTAAFLAAWQRETKA